jgi:flagellar hook-length control protein FliK
MNTDLLSPSASSASKQSNNDLMALVGVKSDARSRSPEIRRGNDDAGSSAKTQTDQGDQDFARKLDAARQADKKDKESDDKATSMEVDPNATATVVPILPVELLPVQVTPVMLGMQTAPQQILPDDPSQILAVTAQGLTDLQNLNQSAGNTVNSLMPALGLVDPNAGKETATDPLAGLLQGLQTGTAEETLNANQSIPNVAPEMQTLQNAAPVTSTVTDPTQTAQIASVPTPTANVQVAQTTNLPKQANVQDLQNKDESAKTEALAGTQSSDATNQGIAIAVNQVIKETKVDTNKNKDQAPVIGQVNTLDQTPKNTSVQPAFDPFTSLRTRAGREARAQDQEPLQSSPSTTTTSSPTVTAPELQTDTNNVPPITANNTPEIQIARTPHRTQAAEFTQTPAEAAATDATVSRQLGRAILQQVGSGDRILVLRLTPPDLGTVRIEVSQQAGQISLRLRAEDDSVRQSIERQLPQLRQDLRANDAPIVDIHLDNQNMTMLSDHQGQGHQAWQQQERNTPQERFVLEGERPNRPAPKPSVRQVVLGGRISAQSIDALA